MSDHLDRAEKALIKNDVATALGALLDGWREKRAAAYADAVDALSKAAARDAKPATHEAWMAIALENDEADVGPLLDALLVGKISTLGGRVEHLVTRPDDPRIAMAFAKAALEPPFTASSNFSIWTKMYDAMTKIGDARIAELLEQRLAEKKGDSNFWPRHYKALEKILAKLPEAPKVSADEKKRLTALAKAAKTAEAAPPPKKKNAAATAKGDPLDRAATAAEAGAWRDCLTALLEAWRPTRIEAFGTAIERVSAILEDGRPPPGGKKVQAAWLAMAAKKDVADIGILADSSGDPKASEAESNMDAMMTWPEDPRIGRAMLVKLYAMTFSDRTRAWQLVGSLIARNADERFNAEIVRLDADHQHTDNKARNSCVHRVVKELPAVLAKVKNELGPVDEKLLKRVSAAVNAYWASDAQHERKFIADIVTDPDSDGPRLVYADWLTERGHPRGELIVLQCAERGGTATEKQRARIKELCEQHPRALLGPAASLIYQNLAYSITSTNIRFDRGLVDELQVYFAVPMWSIAESPLLAAIRTIRPATRGLPMVKDLLRTATSLRAVHGLDFETLIELCQLPEPSALESVSAYHWREPEKPLASMFPGLAGIGLSNVKSFDFTWQRPGGPNLYDPYAFTMPDEMFRSPLMSNVERLSFTNQLGPQIESIRKHSRKVRTITLVRNNWGDARLDVHLDETLAPRSIALVEHPNTETKVSKQNWPAIREALCSIDGAAVAEFRISPRIEFTDATREELDSIAAERFAGASVQVR